MTRAADTSPVSGDGQRLDAVTLASLLAAACPPHHLDLAGAVALPCPLPHADRWRAFVAEGRHGNLDYLVRAPEARLDPTARDGWARTLLVFAQRYTDGWPAADTDPSAGGPPGDPAAPDRPPWTARVARYARGLDYHDLLLGDIRGALAALAAAGLPFRARVAVDTGPYLEREYAWLAGLGFLGRNTCLIHEKLGSGLLLGVALTDLEVDGLPAPGVPATEPLHAIAARRRRATPLAPVSRCGTCTRCVEACPTQAILPGGGLDAGSCLSTWTIERRGEAPAGREAEQGGLLFGCDICQAVCPWNRHAAAVPPPGLPPVREGYDVLPAHADLGLADLVTLDDEAFRARFRRTPLWRAHPEGLRRNAARVLANLARAGKGGDA
jgi:epoxyqueuosine reductase